MSVSQFTSRESVVSVYVNEQDLTSLVVGDLNNVSVTKTLSFTEPYGPAAFALKSYIDSEIYPGSMMLQCMSTRIESPWHLLRSQHDTANNWTIIPGKGVGQNTDTVPLDWFNNSYQGNMFPAESAEGLPGSNSYSIDATCGEVTSSNKLVTVRKIPPNRYWAIRTLVPGSYCGSIDQPEESLHPTSSPTKSPTPVQTHCVPPQVTCCVRFLLFFGGSVSYTTPPTHQFSIQQTLVQVLLSEVDVTAQVVTESGIHVLRFQEPSIPTVLGIKGFEGNEFLMASLTLRCESTDPSSLWNFVSNESTGKTGWKAVKAISLSSNVFPSCWSCVDYSGAQTKAVSLSDSEMSSSSCAQTFSQRLKGEQGYPANSYWALRKLVNQTLESQWTCDLVTPTPTTMAPVMTPTPTVSPSCAFQVTCCFRAYLELTEIFVDNVNLTSLVGILGNTNTVTFPEPEYPAAMAIKGFENNEVFKASLMLRCSSTNALSLWNFDSEVGTGVSSWKSVKALHPKNNVFPANWYTNDYAGLKSPAKSIVDSSYTIEDCNGAGVPSTKVAPDQGIPANHYWGLRKWVNQTSRCGE